MEKQPVKVVKVVSWHDFDAAVNSLVTALHPTSFKAVVGFKRGGLPLAVTLAHRLHVKVVMTTLEFQSFLENVLRSPNTWEEKCNILLVDDISDSGGTFLDLLTSITLPPNWDIWTATWFIRDSTSFVPNTYVGVVTDEWVQFPWENPLGEG